MATKSRFYHERDNFSKDSRVKQIILDSQEKIHQYRKFQDCKKALTIESIAKNEAIIEINKSIYDIKKRHIILATKKEILSFITDLYH